MTPHEAGEIADEMVDHFVRNGVSATDAARQLIRGHGGWGLVRSIVVGYALLHGDRQRQRAQRQAA